MKNIVTLALIAVAGASQADIITQWNFNGASATTVPGGALSPSASVGTGTASLLGGVTASFSSGTANGGSSDPVTTTPTNYGWQTTTYAAQGLEEGQRGVQFSVSTVGYQDISISFDTRHSNTSSRYIRLDYSNNGGASWILGSEGAGTVYAGTSGDTWFNLRGGDLSADTSIDNNANFVFRMVTVFAPGTAAYAASTSTSTYAASGTLRWDMVTVNAAPVPEPGTIAVLGLGALVLLRRRRA